nr:hypothetical protein [Tanacetum cinerariifolium]
ASKVLSMQKDEPTEVQEVVDVVTTAKLITEVVTAASEIVIVTSTIIYAAKPQVTVATITAAPVRVAAASARRRNGVVIRDPKKESTTSSIIPADTKSKDKGKGIMTPTQKAAKRRKLNEEVEDLKRHLEIVPDEDDDVYTEATPLARKLILLVDRRYPLSRFTLDQMLNAVRLRVEEESEMSLELLRFTRQQHQEGQLE